MLVITFNVMCILCEFVITVTNSTKSKIYYKILGKCKNRFRIINFKGFLLFSTPTTKCIELLNDITASLRRNNNYSSLLLSAVINAATKYRLIFSLSEGIIFLALEKRTCFEACLRPTSYKQYFSQDMCSIL